MQNEALTELKNHSRAKLYPGNKEFYIDVFIFLWNLQWVAEELENNLMIISMQDGLENISLQAGSKYSRHAIEYINETRNRVNSAFRKDTEECRAYNDKLQLLESEDNTQEPDFHIKFEGDEEIDLPLPAAEVALYLNRICRYFLPVFQKHVIPQERPQLNNTLKLFFTGNSNQVYDAFRQLKAQGFISNTLDQLAEFIYQHVQFKEGRSPNKSTISAELKRNKRPPKGKQFKMPPTKE